MTVVRTPMRIGIIGGGLAGLSAAHVLARAGAAVTVLDKGRGPGGRASTRRRGAHQFDHGAQYFTARDARFRAVVEAWGERGIVAEWRARFAAIDSAGAFRALPDREARWVGVPGMSAIAGDLVTTLDARAVVRFGTTVQRAVRTSSGWQVSYTDPPGVEHDLHVDALLVCTPAPQAFTLLDGQSPLVTRVREAMMTPCWAAMYAFDAPLDVGADALFVNVPDTPLAWASRDSSKPGRPDGERWVLHASPAWSAARLEASVDIVSQALLDAFQAALGQRLPTPTHAEAHRWRYAQGALDPAPAALVDATQRLVIAGDWCHGARIEGAWLSGLVAAERLLAAIGE